MKKICYILYGIQLLCCMCISAQHSAVRIVPQTAHTQSVTYARFFPSTNNTVFTVSQDNTARIWQIGENEITVLGIISSGSLLKNAVLLSNEKNDISAVVDSSDDITLWNTPSGTYIKTLPHTHDGTIALLVASKNKNENARYMLSVGSDKKAVLWDIYDIANLKAIYTWTLQDNIQCADVYDTGEGIIYIVYAGQANNTAVLLSVDVNTLNSSNSQAVKKNTAYIECDSIISALHITYDGNTILAANDNVVTAWDIGEGKKSQYIHLQNEKHITAITSSQDGVYTAFGTDSSTIYINGIKVYTKAALGITALSFSPDAQKLLVATNMPSPYILAVEKLNQPLYDPSDAIAHTLTTDLQAVIGLHTYEDSVIQILQEKSILRQELFSQNSEYTVTHFSGTLTCSAISPANGLFAVGTWHKEIYVFSDTLSDYIVLQGHGGKINSISFSSDGRYIISSSDDGSLKIWDIQRRQCIQSIEDSDSSFSTAIFAAAGELIYAGDDKGYITILQKKKSDEMIYEFVLIQKIKVHTTHINSVRFSADGEYFFSSSNSEIKKMNSNTDMQLLMNADVFPIKSGIITAFDISSDNTNLIVGLDNGNILIIDVVSGITINTLKGHTQSIRSFTFVSNSTDTLLISASDDSTVKTWSMNKGVCLITKITNTNGEWFSWMEEGYFSGSEKGIHNFARIIESTADVTQISSLKTWACSQLSELLFRPDIVCEKEKGNSITSYIPDIEQTNVLAHSVTGGNAPKVIVESMKVKPVQVDSFEKTLAQSASESEQSRDYEFTFSFTPDKTGGVGTVFIYQNGMAVKVYQPDSPNIVYNSEENKYTVTAIVTLQSGDNSFEARLENEKGTINSREKASVSLNWDGKTEKPSLFILALGINEYANMIPIERSAQSESGIDFVTDEISFLSERQHRPMGIEFVQSSKTVPVQDTISPVIYNNNMEFISFISPLKYAIKDAEDIIETMELYANKTNTYEAVITKRVSEADITKENFPQLFDEFASKIKPDDVFILFFSGHGISFKKDGDYYYISSDTNGIHEAKTKAIDKMLILEQMTRIHAQNSVLILDTCNSGAFADTPVSENTEGAITRLEAQLGRIIISASAAEEVAWEDGQRKNGLFTGSLIQAIEKKYSAKQHEAQNTQSSISLEVFDLARATQKIVREKALILNKKQSPQIVGKKDFSLLSISAEKDFVSTHQGAPVSVPPTVSLNAGEKELPHPAQTTESADMNAIESIKRSAFFGDDWYRRTLIIGIGPVGGEGFIGMNMNFSVNWSFFPCVSFGLRLWELQTGSGSLFFYYASGVTIGSVIPIVEDIRAYIDFVSLWSWITIGDSIPSYMNFIYGFDIGIELYEYDVVCEFKYSLRVVTSNNITHSLGVGWGIGK